MASITKRGKYWRAQIIRRGYPPQYRTFDTKVEAEGWARLIENEMDRGVFVIRSESERTTLAEALERYWTEIASQKRHPKQERRRINHWLKQPLSHYFLANLRGTDFAKYRDERRAQGKAENTVRLELAIISHLFETARKEWGVESLLNPLKNIRKPSGSRERDRRLRAGEYTALISELEKCGNPWVKPMFEIAVETALRQGMLFVLRWEWVSLDRRIITVPQQFRGTGNKAVPAVIPLSQCAVTVLNGLPKAINGKLFPTTQNALVCAWKRALRRLKISDLRWHDLRHEAASRLFEKGLNPMEVATITGHKNLNMLRRYTHLCGENLAAKLG